MKNIFYRNKGSNIGILSFGQYKQTAKVLWCPFLLSQTFKLFLQLQSRNIPIFST